MRPLVRLFGSPAQRTTSHRAIGAILGRCGNNPGAFNGIFVIAHTPGLVAHVIEEQIREKPMRRIDLVNHGYDGPPPRTL
jgi:citrate synthase